MFQLKPLHKKNILNNSGQRPVIQPKLKIGRPGDKYEQEADVVADRVMRMSDSNQMQMQPLEEEEDMMQPKLRLQPMEEEEVLQPRIRMQPMEEEEEMMQMQSFANGENHIQMKCADCEKEEMLQAKSETSGGYASPYISQQIQLSKGNGKPLPPDTKHFMSKAMGADFRGVKIHTDTKAHQMNRQLGARAFTYGNHIYFNKGEYSPSSGRGEHLLAHELTHTVQQRNEIGKTLQKYSHEDCDETTDLRPHIWPADRIAKNMVNSGIAALTAASVSAATNAVLDKHFNSHSASTISSVLTVLRSIKAAFDADDYTYECENDCDDANAYVYAIWSDIHLCMNVLRGKDNKGIAAIIVHECSHYYGGTDDNEYYFSFGVGVVPASLSVSDAVDNADSYEGFAYDI